MKIRNGGLCLSSDICIARDSNLSGYKGPRAWGDSFCASARVGLGPCLRSLDATYGCECRNSVCKGKPVPVCVPPYSA
jgi:hypothetical protein